MLWQKTISGVAKHFMAVDETRIKRLLVISIAAIAVLVVAVVVAVNLYVQSDTVRKRVESAMGEVMGGRVEVARIGYNPFSGLSVRGVKAGRGDGGAAEVDEFHVAFQLLPLFQRSLVVDRVTVKRPVVRMERGARDRPVVGGGAMETPSPDDAPPPDPEGTPGSGVAVMTPEASQSGGVDPVEPEPAAEDPWSYEIREVVLEEGVFIYQDGEGRVVAEVTGIAMEFAPGGDGGGYAGNVTADQAVVRDSLYFTEIASPFVHDGEKLSFEGIRAMLCGGSVGGVLVLDEASPDQPYDVDLDFEGVDVAELMADAGLPADRISGRLEGGAQISGEVGSWESANGAVELRLKGGALQQVQLFQTIGQALKIEELVAFELEEAHANVRVREGAGHVEDLVFASPNLRMESTGVVASDGTLDLDARLYLHRKIRVRLPDMAKDNMRQSEEDPDYTYLDFEIDGTLADPRSNILERLVGESLEKKVNDVLKNLFGN